MPPGSGAVSVVVTFDRHPAAVLAPARVPPLIYPLAKKLRVIASLRPDAACVIRFDKDFSQITGEEFIRGLARDCGKIHSLCVGAAFSSARPFRQRRPAQHAGQGTRICRSCPRRSFPGRPVRQQHPHSRCRPRGAFRPGRANAGPALCAVRRRHQGRAVLAANRFSHRQPGSRRAADAAAGRLCAARALARGRHHPAAVNIGHRPTVASAAPQFHVEAHLLDFAGDIYGQEIELTFLKKLRDEQKFPSLDALRAQIQRDIARVRDLPGNL